MAEISDADVAAMVAMHDRAEALVDGGRCAEFESVAPTAGLLPAVAEALVRDGLLASDVAVARPFLYFHCAPRGGGGGSGGGGVHVSLNLQIRVRASTTEGGGVPTGASKCLCDVVAWPPCRGRGSLSPAAQISAAGVSAVPRLITDLQCSLASLGLLEVCAPARVGLHLV